MSDFVLVGGAWHGAWCWKRVLPMLWSAGHRAFAVSLSGVGERAHLLSPAINLSTHITDVQAVIEAEELQGAILVGHSYAGLVITGVADRVHERLAALVYLDAVVPQPGESWASRNPPETQVERRAAIAATGVIAPAPASAFGLTGADAEWVNRRQTPQPGGVYDEPLNFDANRWAALPRHFISCIDPALPTVAASRQRVREQPGWQVRELATGHDAMVSAPTHLSAALLEIAGKA
ncbi:alpha/beta hydrolase family protein [Paucibacter sp. JuS9]|uniref:alpha/beta fold hydrolase n=1 Tax=Roseateles TaxID=93681 RepID=UPI002FE51A77